MKNVFILCLILSTYLVEESKAQFVQLANPLPSLSNHVAYVSPTEILVGSAIEINISVDGGNSFINEFYRDTTTSTPGINITVYYPQFEIESLQNGFLFEGKTPLGYSVYRSGQINGNWAKVFDSSDFGTNFFLDEMALGDNQTLIIVGNNGVIFRSIDNGDNWTMQTLTHPLNNPLNHFQSVAYMGEGKWIIGNTNCFFKSIDNGLTWTSTLFESSVGQTIRHISVNDNTLFGCSGSAKCQKSVDGGETWTQINLPFNAWRIDHLEGDTYIAFPNAISIDRLYVTYDGGYSWEYTMLPMSIEPVDYDIFDKDHIIMCNQHSDVLLTSNGIGPTLPLSSFVVTSKCSDENILIENYSAYSSEYTYEWYLDGEFVSNQYELPEIQSTAGTHTLIFNVISGIDTVSSTQTFSLTDPPSPPYIHLSNTDFSLCIGDTYSTQLNYQTSGASYTITTADGTVNEISSNFSFTVTEDTYFTIEASKTNVCRTTTATEVVNITCAKPSDSTSFFLPADTVCYNQQPYYVGVINSEIGWHYWVTNTDYQVLNGNGDDSFIPFHISTQSPFNVTLKAKNLEANCISSFPLGTIRPMNPYSMLIVTPDLATIGENLNVSLTSNYLEHHWNLGQSISPQYAEGYPISPEILSAGRDTLQLLEIFADSSCQTTHKEIINCVENISPSAIDNCIQTSINRSAQTIDSKIDLFGNRIFTGYFISNTGHKQLFIRKEDTFGNLIFEKSIENNFESYGIALETDSLNNIYLIGHAEDVSEVWGISIESSSFLIKLSQSGSVFWILNKPRLQFLDLVIKEEDFFVVGQFQSTDGPVFIPQINGPDLLFTEYYSNVNNGALLFRYTLNGEVNEVLPFAVSTSNININLHHALEIGATDPFKYPKMALFQDQIAIGAVCPDIQIGHTYFLGNNPINSDIFNNITDEIDETLLLLTYEINSNEMNGVFYLSAQDLNLNDIVLLENGIVCITEFSNAPYVDIIGDHELEYPDSDRLSCIFKLDDNGNHQWSRIENTTKYTAIEKSGDNEFIAIIQADGISSLLSASNNIGFTTQYNTGSYITNQTTDGEISSFYEIEPSGAIVVQSLCTDLCGNPIISYLKHPTSLESIVSQFDDQHIWHTSKVGSTNCDEYCSSGSVNPHTDLALIDIQLSPENIIDNETNIQLNIQNTGTEIITSALIQIEVNGQIQSYNLELYLLPGQLSGLTEFGTFDLSGFSEHHLSSIIIEVNGTSDSNSSNNFISNSAFRCSEPLSGTYTISNENLGFNTFQQTADALKVCGISGNVTFVVSPGVYFGQLFIDQYQPTDSEFSVSWISSTDNANDVEFHFDPIFMNQSEHIVLGDSVSGITFQSIQLIDSLAFEQESVILLGNACQNISINKCILFGSPEFPQTLVNSPTGSVNQNIELVENTFHEGLIAIAFSGNSQYHDEDILIESNVFHEQYQRSIHTLFNQNTAISKNEFYNLSSTNSIRLKNNTGALAITNNQFIARIDTTIYIENYLGNPVIPASSQITNNFFTMENQNMGLTGLSLKNVADLGIWFNTFEKNIVIDNCQRISVLNNIIGNSDVLIDVRSASSELDFDYNQYYFNNQAEGYFSWFNNENLSLGDWQLLSSLDEQSEIKTPYFLSSDDCHIVGEFTPGLTIDWIDLDIDGEARPEDFPTKGADEPGPIPHQLYLSQLIAPSCYGEADGEVQLVALSAQGESTYLWSDGFSGSTRTGLAAGIYSVVSEDETGEVASLTFELLQPDYFDIQIAIDSICFTGQNATATVQTTTGEEPLTLLWNTGAQSNILYDLSNGEYWVEASSQIGCIARDTILFNALPFQIVSSNIVQPCDTYEPVASIDIDVIGGLGNYSYIWNTGATSQDISGVGSGLYEVIVQDGQGCEQSFSQQIFPPLFISLYGTLPCFSPGMGSIHPNVGGGQPEYEYSWNTGHDSLFLDGVDQGVYELTVADQSGCTISRSFSIQTSLFTLTLDSIHQRCTPTDVAAIFTTLENTDAIAYAHWSDGSNPYQDNLSIYGGGASLVVIDTLGCIKSVSASFGTPPDYEIVDLTECFDGTNGTLAVVQNNFDADSILWSTGETYSVTAIPENGTYTVDLYYSYGCHFTETYVYDRIPLEIQVTNITHPICWYDTGSINTEVLGAVEPVSYSWSNEFDSPNISNLSPGTYILNINDSQDCEQQIEVEIFPPLSPYYSFEIEGVTESYLDSTHIFTTTLPENYSVNWDVDFCDVLETNADSAWVNFDHIGFALINAISTDENGCENQDQITVYVEEFIQVDEIQGFPLLTYPNPFQDQLTIQSGYGKPIDIAIFDAQGKQIWVGKLNQIATLDVSQWAAGNYSVRCSENGSVLRILNVIKQN